MFRVPFTRMTRAFEPVTTLVSLAWSGSSGRTMRSRDSRLHSKENWLRSSENWLRSKESWLRSRLTWCELERPPFGL